MPSPPPTLDNPGGFGLGVSVTSHLTRRGVEFVGWRWDYRIHIGRRLGSFIEHLHLDGQAFSEIPTPDGWFPGDHKGCMCVTLPITRGPITRGQV